MSATMLRRNALCWVAPSILVLCLASASRVEAQATLERVEELARMGRAEEARGALLEWWDAGRAESNRRELQRGLWLRARLTVDPVQAELDFQRLVVLYPRGLFTPQAILRLAQSAYEMGDEEGARRYVATLVRDYPDDPARGRAEAWLRASGPAPAAPDAPATMAPERNADPVTPRTDPAPSGERPEPARAVETQEDSPAEAPPEVGSYFVQLGAFAEEERAVALFEQVTEAGEAVRVVRVEGSRFLHVRIGRFVERADAVDELERLAAAGINAALVRDERAEQLVRE